MTTGSNSPINLTGDEDELHCNTQSPATNAQGRKLKSFVWQHMDRQLLTDGTIKATCNHCKGTFNANSSSGTSHLKRHIEKCPKRMNHDIKKICISSSPSSGDTSNMPLRNPNVNFEEGMVSRIKITLFDLFDEYKGVACGSTSPIATSLGMPNVSHGVGCGEDQMDDILEYKMFLSKKRKVDNEKSELEPYLEEKNPDVMGKCSSYSVDGEEDEDENEVNEDFFTLE
ncbi:hypothetical protein L6452_35814 [Arctium lappa]|uniref:Uncharacterized protein n=1 Tax=Arctium lappa TaxID=4217 RepID=A0ACB8Y808_ARCLA|nr:hypothetical protein L6452_35814 [Arctium lappa]